MLVSYLSDLKKSSVVFPFVSDNSERYQEPSVKKGSNLLQDYAQAAGETHSESGVDSEQVTLHFSVNGKCVIT